MDLGKPRFVGLGRLPATGGWRMKAHAHPFHQLIVPLRGRLEARIEGKCHAAGPGQVLLYPPYIPHEERALSSELLETYFIGIRWESPPASLPVRVPDPHGRIRQMASWLFLERDSASPFARPQRRALIQAMLAEFLAAATFNASEHELVEAVRRYIRAHLAESLALEDLAGHVGMSKYHFLRRYRALTGRTPMADVRVLRLEHARDLILTTDLTLKCIAPQAGLGSTYALSRLFRRHFDLTPGQLRSGVAPNR